MKLVCLTEDKIRSMFYSLTVNNDLKNKINEMINSFNPSYVDFIHTLFACYMNVYIRINDENSHLSEPEMYQALKEFSSINKNFTTDNMYVADKYDVLFGITCVSDYNHLKFNEFFYEEIHERLVSLYGLDVAGECLQEVFDCIEFVVNLLECSLFSLIDVYDQHYLSQKTNYMFYMDVLKDKLLFFIS